MAPKRKTTSEDTRSPLEIAIAGTEEQIKSVESQVQMFRDGVSDLAVHTQRIKHLETEIVPKEAELKSILNNFNKLLENSVAVARMKPLADELGASANGPGSRSGSRAASRGAATPLPPQAPTADDIADREFLKVYTAIVREQLTAIIVPLFKQERTTLEQQVEEAREKEAHEAQAAAAAAAAAAASGGVPPASAATGTKPPAPAAAASTAKPGGAAAGGKAADKSGAVFSSSELAARVDLDIYRPPGLDHHLTQDVLRLRAQRLGVERQLKTLQQQLVHSRQLVARRTNEGASKAALKKAEKSLSSLISSLRDLKRQRDEHEVRKKSETPQPTNLKVKAAASAKK